MAFDIRTLDESHSILIALHKAMLPDIDVSQMATDWLWLRTFAGGTTGNQAQTESVKTNLMPDTATGDLLQRWAKIRGVKPKTATPARKDDAFRAFGVAATSVPDGSTLTHVSGLRFKTVGANAIGAAGYVDCDLVAIDTGSATRLNAGETLTFDTPIANVEEEGELQLDLDEDGDDAESDPSIQKRVGSRFSDPPLGGARSDYEIWVTEVTGWASAYVYPLRNGLGTVDVAPLHAGSGADGARVAPEVAELQSLIDTKKRPVSVKGFRVLLVTTSATNVEVTLLPDGLPEHEFDWDDTVPPVVSSWTAATRVLKFTGGTRPATMEAGDRLTIAQGATARERVIEVLGPAADEVTLEADALGDVPAATNTVYAGGPLVEPARAAIQALFDSLGTANPDSKRYGAWEGNLRLGKLRGAAEGVVGVIEAVAIVPVATVEAADLVYPANTSVGLLIAARLLVRRAH
jgi:uncharacterized phage protein gp47/JayE